MDLFINYWKNHFFHFLSVLIVIFLVVASEDEEIKCLVCRKLVEEIDYSIKKVDPKIKIQVGSYRIDAKGNQHQTKIPFARSEIHIHEILEELCTRMKDYVQAKYKDTGEKTVIKLIDADGNMNSETSKVDFIPDPDLNKKLVFYCEHLVEEHEDDIIRIFKKETKDQDIQLCTKAAGVCQDSEEDDDYRFEDRDEL